MEETYLDICGMPTKILTWGKTVEEGFKKDEAKDIVLMIPGNPGITKFYCEFLQTVHDRLGYPVWVVGHAGHEPPEKLNRPIPALEGNERMYGLQGQILYKQAFIEKYLPKDAKIHFIGHSIGAYMILQLQKIRSIRSRTVKSYLLFPTIEHLADTTYGKMLSNTIPPIAPALLFIAWLFTFIPSVIRVLLFQFFLTCCFISKAALSGQTVADLVEPKVLKKALALAMDEMTFVRERDNEILEENKNKIKLYYAANDGWAPTSYCKKLQNEITGIDAEICRQNIGHGFVVKRSRDMGNIVADWIKS